MKCCTADVRGARLVLHLKVWFLFCLHMRTKGSGITCFTDSFTNVGHHVHGVNWWDG